MRIDAGLDTGDMLLRAETAIGPEENAVELGARLAQMGADLLVETLARIEEIVPEKQNHAEATLAPILKKEDGRIDFTQSAQTIHNRIRGFQPWPGGYTRFRGQTLNIWKSRVAADAVELGTLVRAGRRVLAGCGEGSIELVEVQLEGKKRMAAEAFANGQRLTDTEALGD